MTEHDAVAVSPARLRLLGGWQLLLDGVEIALGHREERLLALLGLTDIADRPRIASVLWPESTDERALASLRRAVSQFQKRCPGLIDARRTTIALVPEVRVDVDDVRRAAGLTQLPMSGEVARELLVALRGDELLPGWYDDWVIAERDRLQDLRVEALDRISRQALDAGDLELAIEAARATSGLDPLLESPREVSIRAHLGRGDLSTALHEFQRYSGLMQEELGVAPSSMIVGLLEPVLNGSPSGPAPAPIQLPHPRVALPEESLPDESLPSESLPSEHQPEVVADGDRDDASAEGRLAHRTLASVVGLALAAALAIAMSGPDRRGEPTTDPGAGTALVRPADPPSGGGTDRDPQPIREVAVRAVRSDVGSAAFSVRATMRPARVTLIVRGRAGLRVVRHVVVRGAAGNEVVLDGLDPGTYRWSATSASASQVDGVVSVDPPAEESVGEEPAAVATTAPAVAPVAATTTSTPSPTSTPTPTPTPTSTSTPTSTPSPSPSPSQSPSPSPQPTGTPSDPGTVAPTPVG